MPELTGTAALILVAGFVFSFTNGWADAVQSISTAVSTRVWGPMQAVLLAGVFHALGALFGVEVARVVGLSILPPGSATPPAVLAALTAGVLWTAAATALGLPVSSSHALLGGLVGAGMARVGWAVLATKGFKLVLAAAVLGPLAAGLGGWAVLALLRGLLGGQPVGLVHRWLRFCQVLSAAALSAGHGTSDGQKAMGVLALGLGAAHVLARFEVPAYVRLGVALALGLGTAAGGWAVVRSLGVRVLHLDPPSGFATEASSAGVLFLAAAAGVPVSATHAVTGAILGVGAAGRTRFVRWGLAGPVLWVWAVTLPGAAVVGYAAARVLGAILG